MYLVNKRLVPQISQTTKKFFIEDALVQPVHVKVSNSPFYPTDFATNYLAPGIIPNFLSLCIGKIGSPTLEVDPSELKLKGILVELKDFKGDTIYGNIELDIDFTKGRTDYYIVQRLECQRGMMFEITDNNGTIIGRVLKSIDLNLSFDRRKGTLKLNRTKVDDCKVVGFDIEAAWMDNNITYTA